MVEIDRPIEIAGEVMLLARLPEGEGALPFAIVDHVVSIAERPESATVWHDARPKEDA
jgi:hypothetical protein